MKNFNVFICFNTVVIVLLFLTTIAFSNDYNELRLLNFNQLTKQIVNFNKHLENNPNDYEILKAIGIAYHFKAIQKVKKNAQKSVTFLSKSLEINGKDNETLCYLGSATTMLANTTWNPIKKMSHANKGISFMDKAIRRDPDNITVRMTRGNNSINLPSFLKRVDTGIEDFQYLAALIEEDPEKHKSIAKEVFSSLAILYNKKEQPIKAKEYQKRADNFI